jgi:hypothetical protein
MVGWMLYFAIVSSPLTVSGTHPVGSAEECVEVAYEKLREFNKEHRTPVRVFQVLCAPEGK